MTGKPRLLAIAVFSISVLSLMLTACANPTVLLTVPENAKPGDVLLRPCKVGEREADCGSLIVPENPAKSDSRLIALPITRIHATGSNPAEPIFFLDGGPGEALNLHFDPPAALLAKHDVVLLGYRGVDGSSLLDCPEVSQAMRGVGGNLLSEASHANLSAARATCAQRLQNMGVDLSGYTLPNVVADLEAARVGLNYPRINLLTRGYGTRVAELYADRYPDRVLRSALIGPAVPGHSMIFEPEMIDAQIETYARMCAEDARCSARTSDLAATMRNVTHHMPERWLLFPIDTGKVRVATFLLLKRTQNAATIFDAYLAAESGDPSGLLTIQTLYDIEVPITWNAWGDFYAKNGIDYDPSRDYTADMALGDSILGSPFSQLVWSGDLGWPMTAVPAASRELHSSNVRTLLVTGSVDARFPPEYVTRELLPHLTNAQQVMVAEAGHELLDVQRPALDRLLTSFFDTGVGDDSLYTYVPMDFAVTSNAPALAKLALGGGVLIVTLIIAATWLIVRRMRRRRSTRSI
jgi:pimeloyl-ACP methyl ester carboxylesterase